MMLVVQLAGLAQRVRNWRFRNTKRWNCWLGEAVGPWNAVFRVWQPPFPWLASKYAASKGMYVVVNWRVLGQRE
jgi:hypothetical protein